MIIPRICARTSQELREFRAAAVAALREERLALVKEEDGLVHLSLPKQALQWASLAASEGLVR